MKDLHSHYLAGVDDGARDIEMTEKMLELAKENGITSIMCTPHYILDSDYLSNVEQNTAIFSKVKELAEKFGISIYLGNEVYCNTSIIELVKKGCIRTLNGSRYMLIEIPMYSKMNNVKSIFFELISNGIIPILAHPERYTAYYNDIDFFFELREMGVLMQLNVTSLLGFYGSREKKMAKKLVKANLISFIGSDFHHPNKEKYQALEKALKKLEKLVDNETYQALVEDNFERVIRNQEI